jgi:hypothetical protein
MYMSFAGFILQSDWKYCDEKYDVIQLFCKLLETNHKINTELCNIKGVS